METNINPINDFSDAKVGDLVTSIIYGKGKIIEISGDTYPIHVSFEIDNGSEYSVDGKELIIEIIPTLYKGHIDFKIEPILPVIKKFKYRPYSNPNYSLLTRVVKSKFAESKFVITAVGENNTYFVGLKLHGALDLLARFTFEDDTLCGELDE